MYRPPDCCRPRRLLVCLLVRRVSLRLYLFYANVLTSITFSLTSCKNSPRFDTAVPMNISVFCSVIFSSAASLHCSAYSSTRMAGIFKITEGKCFYSIVKRRSHQLVTSNFLNCIFTDDHCWDTLPKYEQMRLAVK